MSCKEGEAVAQLVRRLVQSDCMRPIFREWALQLVQGDDGSVFSSLFLEILRDPAQDPEFRKTITIFFNTLYTRKWKQMRRMMKAWVPGDVAKAFRKTRAEAFFEVFRAQVGTAILEYWKAFIDRRRGGGLGPKAWSPRDKK